MARCVNIDWLEVYCLEDKVRFPLNAEYFREHGYMVKEREYGTRHYAEMFTICDNNGEPWLEVRRNPQSGESSFSGFVPESCRLRLVNWACYQDDCVVRLRDFMILHDYIYKRIARIDICNDFVLFDSGDRPDKFAQRYFNKKYSKVNQCKVHSFANDGWASFDWESISWGSPASMVGTKLYNKSKELMAGGNKKPYIQQAWFAAGIVDSPLSSVDVWRVEFSMKSHIEGWLEIEDISGKKIHKRKIPHQLQIFDGRERLWQRFEDLAYHYFHFKVVEYKGDVDSSGDRQLKRKDLCRDKVLFHFNQDRTFYKLQSPSRVSRPETEAEHLKRKIQDMMIVTGDMRVRDAMQIVIEYLDRRLLIRHTEHGFYEELLQLQIAIATRLGTSPKESREIAKQTLELIKQKEIW